VDQIDLSDFTIRPFTRPEYRLGAPAFSPDGTTLFVTGWDEHIVEIFDAATGAFLGDFAAPGPGDPGYLANATFILFAPPTGE
jgi:hypothetical protein